MFLLLFVCLSVNRITQKLPGQFFMTPGGRVVHGPRKNPEHFGADWAQRLNPQYLFLFLQNGKIGHVVLADSYVCGKFLHLW